MKSVSNSRFFYTKEHRRWHFRQPKLFTNESRQTKANDSSIFARIRFKSEMIVLRICYVNCFDFNAVLRFNCAAHDAISKEI